MRRTRDDKVLLKTRSGLLNPSQVSLRDRSFFNDKNDHNPVVGTLCSKCRGTGRLAGMSEKSYPACESCDGIGALDIPVHFFPNDRPPLEAKARKDDWIRCPGCSTAFSLERGLWTGWRHICGLRIVVRPPEGSTKLSELVRRGRRRLQKLHLAVRAFVQTIFELWLISLGVATLIAPLIIYLIWFSSNPELSQAVSEPHPPKAFIWYAQHRSALGSVSFWDLTGGYLATAGIAWVATCLASKCIDLFDWHRLGNSLGELFEALFAVIFLFGPTYAASLFVFPVVALREITFPPFPSFHWSQFSQHILLSTGAIITWTATVLGLVASVITIYQTITKPPRA